jgi:hypothetical protein
VEDEQGPRAEHILDPGNVRHNDGNGRLEDEAEVENAVAHALHPMKQIEYGTRYGVNICCGLMCVLAIKSLPADFFLLE